MPTRTLEDEVSKLKSDADTKKPARSRRTGKKAQDKPAPDEVDGDDEKVQELAELGQKLSHLVESAEDEIKAHPVAVTLGAFALGIVVGAMLRR